MKASEIIKELAGLIKCYGDREVFLSLWDKSAGADISKVEKRKENSDFWICGE